MSRWLDNVIGTPVECLKVTSEMEYLLWAKRAMHSQASAPILRDHEGEQPLAVVNDSRWIARCACGNACIAHPGGTPEWPKPVAVCGECGTVYRPIFPANRELAETVLLARPDVKTRHFENHERLADLILENQAHDLPKRRKDPEGEHGLDEAELETVRARNKAIDREFRKAGN